MKSNDLLTSGFSYYMLLYVITRLSWLLHAVVCNNTPLAKVSKALHKTQKLSKIVLKPRPSRFCTPPFQGITWLQ